MPKRAHFNPKLFRFLEDLKANNDRAWFQDNKARYADEVQAPLIAFVGDFAGKLEKIAPKFVADPRPTGGSIFRIHRDVRFSKDKSPYKTHAAAHFRYGGGKDVHGPGFYLHLEPGQVFAAGGLWHPDVKPLAQVRDAIAAKPGEWKKAIGGKAFKEGMTLGGEKLTRAPKGYDPEHPMIEYLRHKDFVASVSFTQKEACAPDFMDRYAETCRAMAPLMKFLTAAVGLPYA
jgi:uncharacterized protein (TIGR02453 family)